MYSSTVHFWLPSSRSRNNSCKKIGKKEREEGKRGGGMDEKREGRKRKEKGKGRGGKGEKNGTHTQKMGLHIIFHWGRK